MTEDDIQLQLMTDLITGLDLLLTTVFLTENE
jgi:hypothetical protein